MLFFKQAPADATGDDDELPDLDNDDDDDAPIDGAKFVRQVPTVCRPMRPLL